MIDLGGESKFEDCKELLNESELTSLVVYENSGRRVDPSVEQNFALQVLTRVEDHEFEIRCKATLAARGGQYIADAGAVFTLKTSGKIDDATMREFSAKVGVMVVYPYLRATVGQAASSLGLDSPVLPLLRSGEITLNAEKPGSAPADN
ncbi:hypothetical protein ACNO8X_26050 [Mycobacterium sp. PDNC021]|uniref:hypothetical protein n=1 Tax=Mycobacterium sp. PDNC021 TaxID=3391399 RepID=UPI003AAE4628